ncbi:hypothetical protein MARBORIA2_14820 [Methanobrevibacter arboriphilus]|jgi:hypothetical protein|uniref:hypothetical protein n=1 Tax=Methanobrevibacter arboriphilus TaxID=39441 RepID=UPI0022EEB118|nr:hypothetical protein [Methanobrevibacter arboriphilus]GLI12392.1 hypothetical protein MARBORIA2_14820 [Methanobrevibacter arboriphilus]
MIVNDYRVLNESWFVNFIEKSLIKNRHIPEDIKKGVLEYPQQLLLIYYCFKFNIDPESLSPQINNILCGGGKYGGKTLMGAVIALLLAEEKITITVTRQLYNDLFEDGKNSIYGYITMWDNQLYPNGNGLKWNAQERQYTTLGGAVIKFRAFNYDKKADSTQSKSNHIIINDEALQNSKKILDNLKSTLRQDKNSFYPLLFLCFGNPQLNNLTVNNYFDKTYIKDKTKTNYFYIRLQWDTNPHIKQAEYEQTLNEMDEDEKQAYKNGNFSHIPGVTGFIKKELMDTRCINVDKFIKSLHDTSSILFMDLAGRGRDKFAVWTYTYDYNTGNMFLDNASQTKTEEGEELIISHVEEDNDNGRYPGVGILEMEGGSFLYTEKYWYDIFDNLDMDLDVEKPVGNKYARAIPLRKGLKNEKVYINERLKEKNYTEDEITQDYYTLFCNEMLQMKPIMEVSPNLVDSATLGYNWIRNNKHYLRKAVASVV